MSPLFLDYEPFGDNGPFKSLLGKPLCWDMAYKLVLIINKVEGLGVD